jgi:beta-N-acetylhexosaminidase
MVSIQLKIKESSFSRLSINILLIIPFVFSHIEVFAQSKRTEKEVHLMVDSIISRMSLREKIGQTMLMLPDKKLEAKLGNGSIKEFFAKYPVSGFFMGWKLFDGVEKQNYRSYIVKATYNYQAASKYPLFFQQDYEAGVGLDSTTAFPSLMSLGAANSASLSYNYGRSVAKESASVGVNWVLHPVADLNINPLNPITNVRSISDNPDLAIQLLRNQIAGLQNNGVAATIKHFPGDGVDFRDQHLTTTVNALSLKEWKKNHGKVFQALIDSGVYCIMPGHITLPAYQKEKLNGFLLPATLSKELMTDLLKKKMRFNGIIVSDAMVMGGFRGYYKNQLEGEIASFKAGVDVLLWPSYAFLDSIEQQISSGEIPMERLDDAVRRVISIKVKLGLFDKNHALIRPISDEESKASNEVARLIAEKSLTLIRDHNKSIPFPVTVKKILVVGVAPISRKGGSDALDNLKQLKAAFEKQGFEVDFQHNILYEVNGWEEDLTQKYDKIIIAIDRRPHSPFGPLNFYDDEAQTAWGINAMPKDKIVVVSFGSPYHINEYFERVNTCINVYSNTPATQTALVQALKGEIPFVGISPVKLKK